MALNRDRARRAARIEKASVVGPDPAISPVAALAAAVHISRLQARQRVGRQGVALRLHVEAVDARRIQAEDLGLVLFGDLLVAELLADLIGDLEALERVDHPLRRSPPQ